MEADEIGVVLGRASELHAKICEAIDRASKSHHLRGTSGQVSDFDNGPSREEGDTLRDGAEEVEEEEGLNASEVRSLGCIRDALEMLETQLESLQSVQQQQRLRRDAALVELEESRTILLQRLKDHEGGESEVVHEALAFVGEPVKKSDDLPLPPYLHPVSIPSVKTQSPFLGSSRLDVNSQDNQQQDMNSSAEEERGDEAVEDTGSVTAEKQEEEITPRRGILGFCSNVLRLTGKTPLLVMGLIAIVAVSDIEFTSRASRNAQSSYSKPVPKPQAAPVEPVAQPKAAPVRQCGPGKKLIKEDGESKCVVKERVELPFPREIKTPDVLHGRG